MFPFAFKETKHPHNTGAPFRMLAVPACCLWMKTIANKVVAYVWCKREGCLRLCTWAPCPGIWSALARRSVLGHCASVRNFGRLKLRVNCPGRLLADEHAYPGNAVDGCGCCLMRRCFRRNHNTQAVLGPLLAISLIAAGASNLKAVYGLAYVTSDPEQSPTVLFIKWLGSRLSWPSPFVFGCSNASNLVLRTAWLATRLAIAIRVCLAACFKSC